jgi:hypothetical protein
MKTTIRSTEETFKIDGNPYWDRLENDVITRIRALRALCEHWDDLDVPVVGPWFKEKVIADLVMPNLELLSTFCLAVKIKDTDNP